MECYGVGWPCRSDGCETIADVGDWCIGHAVGRYRAQTIRREPVRVPPVILPVCAVAGCENAAYEAGDRCAKCRRAKRR